jgi:hypothetical protein
MGDPQFFTTIGHTQTTQWVVVLSFPWKIISDPKLHFSWGIL